MRIDPYLDRIEYHGSREPTTETLRQLHRAHMLAGNSVGAYHVVQ